MKKAGLYVRVSTLEQAREGYSIGAQTEKLKAYATAKDAEIYDIYTDAGKSGAKLERPELQRMIEDVKSGKIDVVIVYKLDRISRSQKDTLYLIQNIFQPNGVDFVSMQESFDTSTSFGIAMVGILSVFAELERNTISERLEMGRVERAKDGYYHGGGRFQPLGYEYIDGELIINEYEANIVREIFNLYIDGNSMNTTADKIKNKYPDRIKSFTIVKDALTKVLYIGKVQFDGEVYDGRHERIISDETFYLAQKKRKERAVGSTSTNKRKGLLVSKMHCAHCGAKYRREVTGSKKYRYIKYACYSKSRSRATENMIKDRNCKNKRWDEHELDKKVINYLKAMDYAKILKESQPKQVYDYKKEIKKVDSEISRLMKLYTTEIIDMDNLKKMTDELNTKRDNLIELDKEQATELKSDRRQDFYQSMDNFDWENASREDLMKVVDTLVDRIILDNDDVTIHLNF